MPPFTACQLSSQVVSCTIHLWWYCAIGMQGGQAAMMCETTMQVHTYVAAQQCTKLLLEVGHVVHKRQRTGVPPRTQIMRPRSMHVTCVEDRLGLWPGHICTKAVASNNTLHPHHTQTSQYSAMARLLAQCQEPSSIRTRNRESCTGCLPPHSIQRQTILF